MNYLYVNKTVGRCSICSIESFKKMQSLKKKVEKLLDNIVFLVDSITRSCLSSLLFHLDFQQIYPLSL